MVMNRGSRILGRITETRSLFRGVLPAEMFPAEQPGETETLYMHLMEALVLRGRLTGRLEVDGPLGDPVNVACGCQEVVTKQVVREHNTVKDVFLGQRSHLDNMTDLDAVVGNHGRVRANGSPRNHGFRCIAHCFEHTPSWSVAPAVMRGRRPR